MYIVLILSTLVVFWLSFWVVIYIRKGPDSFIPLLLSHAALLFCLIVIELTAFIGILDFRLILGTMGDQPWFHPANDTDDTLLHIHKPNLRLQGVQPTGDIGFYFTVEQPTSYTFDVTIDEQGFRNSSFPEQSDLVVIGDSFLEGTLVSESELLTTQLQTLTGSTVTNLGQIWYGPQQELEVLKRFGIGLEPKVVFWLFFSGNDISDYKRYEQTKAHWEQVLAKRNSRLRRSFVWNLFKRTYLSLRPPVRPAARSAVCGESDDLYYFNYKPKNLNAEATALIERIAATIQTAIETANNAGAHFVFTYAPIKEEVMHSLCDMSEPDSERKQLLLTSISGLQGDFSILDLTPDLTQATHSKATYLVDDTHWNPTGHQVVAETLAAHLHARSVKAQPGNAPITN